MRFIFPFVFLFAVKLLAANSLSVTYDTSSRKVAPTNLVFNGNVKFWGAVGDGVTDDTVAITAAHAAVTNVYYPPGVYLVDGTTVPIGDNFQIRTDGPGSVTLKRTVGGSAVLTAAENRGATNVVITGVRFEGPGWNSGDSIVNSAVKLATNSTYGAIFQDCIFEKFVSGVRSQRGNTNLSVLNSVGRANAFAMVLAYAPVNGKFVGNRVDGSRTGVGDGVRQWTGIWLADPGDGAGPGYGNLVSGNRISTLRNEGIICSQAFSIVTDNIVTDCTDGADGTYGIIVETTGDSGSGLVGLGAGNWVTVANNQVYNCDGGIRISLDPIHPVEATPQDVFVTGNLVEGCYGASSKGISVGFNGTGTNYYTYRANVSDNWIHNATATGNADGVYLMNVQSGSVTGNHVYNAKRYGVILDTIIANGTNQVNGVSITGNDVHDPGSAGIFLYPRVTNSIVRCSVVANTIAWSTPASGYGIQADNGVTNGLVNCAFLGNNINGDPSYNVGISVSGSNLSAAGNVGNVVYGKTIEENGTTTWLSNGAVNDVNGRRVFFGTTAPGSSSSQQNVGDLCYNTSPTSGGTAVWICTTAGVAGVSAGVWKDIGIVGAQAALDLKYDKTGGTISGNASITGTLGVTGVLTGSSDITIPNNKNFRAYDTGGTLRNVLGIDGSNFLQIGDGAPSRTVINVGTSGLYLGTVSFGSDIYIPRLGVASGANTLRNSRGLDFITSYWNGSAEVQVDNSIRGIAVNTNGKTAIQFLINGYTSATFNSDGSVSFPGSFSSPAIDAGGSGFTGSGAGLNSLNGSSINAGKITASVGGTGITNYTIGDTLYASATNVVSKLPIGSDGYVYTVASGVPAWSATLPSTIISVTENTQTGTTYTVQSTDNGKVVTLNNASAITVTVPSLSAGFSCTFIQKGAGQVTFSASGTTINNAHSQTKTYGQYSAVTLYGLSSTSFVLAGDTGS